MGDRAAKDALFDAFAEVAKALASGRRAEIVDVLAQGERSVERDRRRDRPERRQHLASPAGDGPGRCAAHPARRHPHLLHARPATASATLWAALRDVAAEHVAGIERTRRRLPRRPRRSRAGRAGASSQPASSAGDIVVLDVRPSAEYEAGHIAGARSVPGRRAAPASACAAQGHRGRRLLPRPVLRVRRRRRARTAPTRLPRPAPRRRIPGMETSRPARRGRRQEDDHARRSARRRRHAARRRCATSTARSPSTRTAPSTSTPAARSPPASATTRRSSTRCPIGRSSRSPVSATRSRCGALEPGERVVDVGSGAGFDSFIAADQVGPTGRVVGDRHDPRDARQVARHRRGSSASTTSSSARASPKRCRSRTGGPTS